MEDFGSDYLMIQYQFFLSSQRLVLARDRPILSNRFLPIPILTDSLILNLADTDTDFQQ